MMDENNKRSRRLAVPPDGVASELEIDVRVLRAAYWALVWVPRLMFGFAAVMLPVAIGAAIYGLTQSSPP